MTTETAGAVENRIPASLADQAIFVTFCNVILSAVDEISSYNEKVLGGNKDSEWNTYKLLDKAREMGRPETGEPNAKVLEALKAYEELQTAVNKARTDVVQTAAAELGIEFSGGDQRDPEVETPLKEKRKVAINVGDQLKQMGTYLPAGQMKDDILSFLENYSIPAVGRNQSHSFTDETAAAPKYRVKVTVSKDDTVLFEADGFTKAAAALPKYYERGQAPGADKLRAAWEAAGNTVKNTVKQVVEFTDNDLIFTITKK